MNFRRPFGGGFQCEISEQVYSCSVCQSVIFPTQMYIHCVPLCTHFLTRGTEHLISCPSSVDDGCHCSSSGRHPSFRHGSVTAPKDLERDLP